MITPVILASPSTINSVFPNPIVVLLAVVTPEILTLSNSVCPSTSKSPLASIAPVKVDAPDTLRSSNSVWPSTSIPPVPISSVVNVPTPEELIFLTDVKSSKFASIFPTANLVPADIDVVPTPNA